MERIQGTQFKAMIVNGGNLLTNHYTTIDALNVFPVPDGDTGTNMNLTFANGVKEISNIKSDHVGDIAKVLSKGLLMGARGNSGVILSQIFRGFYQCVEGAESIDAHLFASALVKGSEIAYKAVMRPVEGTILTVIRESSAETLKYVQENKITQIEDVMEFLVESAKKSLQHTPELLPVLKEVGVVDSGGAGLVVILEGFKASVNGLVIEAKEAGDVSNSIANSLESEEFGYCTEFIFRIGDDKINAFDENKLKKALARIGESLVVVRDEELVKVHVHTLVPGEALNIAQRYGEFIKLKIENMSEQHSNLVEKGNAPDQKTQSEYGIIAVAAGEGIVDYFKELRVDIVVSGGQTMNPSTEDFIGAIKKLNAKHIIILPNNSNIIMAANQASDVMGDVDIQVIPTKSIPQGIAACIMFNPEANMDLNMEEMTNAVNHIVTGQVTYAIKDTTFDGLAINANDYMGIKEKNIVVAKPNRLEVTKELLQNMLNEEAELVTLIVGEDTNVDETNALEAFVLDNYDVEVEIIEGKQPVYSYFIGVE